MFQLREDLTGSLVTMETDWYARLMEGIGSARFSGSLRELFATVDIAEICIVNPEKGRVISMLSEEGPGDPDLATCVMARHQKLCAETDGADASCSLHHLDFADMPGLNARRLRGRYAGETVIIGRAAEGLVTVHLYYRRMPLSVNHMLDGLLRAVYPMLIAHLRLYTRARSGGFSLAQITARLQERFPELTEREVAVCARSLFGLTTEGLSLDLGIKLTTALTYRRRAYARLNISSLQQLSLMVLG